ncbi:MAG: hypothetical protein V3R22_01590, partial [Kiloniellales bacterium]
MPTRSWYTSTRFRQSCRRCQSSSSSRPRRRPKTARYDDRHQQERQTGGAEGRAVDGRDSTGRALVLYPQIGKTARSDRSPEALLAEGVALAQAINLDVVAQEIVAVPRPKPATLLGKGVVASLGHVVQVWEVTVVVVNSALTPVQQRNLETAWDCKVIDRTGL